VLDRTVSQVRGLHVLYVIDSLVPGGAERSLVDLAPGLVRAGVRLEVAYLHDRPGLQDRLAAAGAELACLDGPGGRIGWIRRTRRLVAERRPDLIHTTLFEADVAGRTASILTRVPVVSSLVNPEYGPEQFADPRLSSWKLRAAQAVDVATARRVRRFHAVSEEVARVMATRLFVPRPRIDVVPRGRDPVLLGERGPERRQRVRAALGIDPGTSMVLAVARHEHQKGLDVLLDSLPAIVATGRPIHLLVAGREGDLTPRLRELTERHALKDVVTLLGTRSDVPDLLCAADVFAFPTRWEGLPGTVLEAMALEAPIVATDIPPVREAVGEGCALLVPVESPRAFADAVIALLESPDAATERARRARARFLERFTIDRSVAGMLAFYERAITPS
jgi:glycosyltransferase involved in cell wall biosynthesis